MASIEVEDEKIPTYDLVINKIEKGTGTQEIAAVPVVGAKFKLYKDNLEKGTYTTDGEGHISINGLYLYEESKNIDQTYTLKETFAPEGYAKVKDITFKAQIIDSTLTLITDDNLSYTTENNTINLKVEDSKSFKLIKKDGETNALLPNVKFAIYNEDEGETPARNSKGEIIGNKETINGREYYTLTTNSRGEITADLPEGIYRAVEVEAADKYDIKGQEQYFGIGESRETKQIVYPEYATSFGGPNSDLIKSIVLTKDGGYYIGGQFKESMQVVDYTLNSNGGLDAFFVKYDSNDEVEWASSFGGDNDEFLNSVAVTKDGGHIVGGSFYSSSMQVGDYTLTKDGRGPDSFLVKYDSNNEVEWASSFGGTGDDNIISVESTEDGGYIVGGNTNSSSMQVGPYTLTNKGRNDVFLIKYDSNNEVEWTSLFGGTREEYIRSIAATEDGGYIVGGNFNSPSMQVGDYTLTCNDNYYDAFLVKYDSNNEVEWGTSYGGDNNDYIQSIATTEDGGYIVGGYFAGTNQAIGNYTLSSNGEEDICIVKYNSDNEVEWASSFGGTREEHIQSIAATEDGGYIVGGNFNSSSIQIGDYTLTRNGNASNYDAYLVKYDRNNEVEWASSFGETGDENTYSIAVTEDGNYIVGGYFYSSSMQVGDYTLTNKGVYDAFIVKYKPKEIGEVVYKNVNQIGGTNYQYLQSIAEIKDGGYIVGGDFKDSSLQVGEYTLNNNGNYDPFLVKYDSNNKVEWASSFGGINEDRITSIAATKDGGYIVGGYFNSPSMQVEDYTLTRTDGTDAFLIKYNGNNEVEWASSFGGTSADSIESIAVTEDGGYIVGGNTNSSSMQVGPYTLTNKGRNDVFLIKYDSNNKVEWTSLLGGFDSDYLTSIETTEDGGYLVGGWFESLSMRVGDYTFIQNGGSDAFLIKYDRNNEVEWASSLGGPNFENIQSIVVTEDGGYIVGGKFESPSMQVGDYTLTRKGATDAFLIKYNGNNEVEWASSFGGTGYEDLELIERTVDGGYIVGGKFNSLSMQVEGYTLTSKGSYDDYVVKYDSNNKVEWTSSFGGTGNEYIKSIAVTEDGRYIVGGYFNSSSMQIGDYVLTNKGNSNAFLLQLNVYKGANEQEEITFENQRKEYKITTDVKEIDGIKGGSISGEDKASYEKVKYGDTSTKPIIMTPDENYEIIGITVNGKEYQYTTLPDGSYQMPQFENMTEDKHIVVTYSLKDNKIILNKVDKDTREKLSNVEFHLDQIDERTNLVNSEVIGSLTDNCTTNINYDNEITGTIGEPSDDFELHFVTFDNTDGTKYYVPMNGETYQKANGQSYLPYTLHAQSDFLIDLSELNGFYKLVIDVTSKGGRNRESVYT